MFVNIASRCEIEVNNDHNLWAFPPAALIRSTATTTTRRHTTIMSLSIYLSNLHLPENVFISDDNPRRAPSASADAIFPGQSYTEPESRWSACSTSSSLPSKPVRRCERKERMIEMKHLPRHTGRQGFPTSVGKRSLQHRSD